MSLFILDNFSSEAQDLRLYFDKQFAQPLKAHSKRFVWDYWCVPGQYQALRTPAYSYFPAKKYRNLHEEIVLWGRRNLGCHDISPPWLSCYIEGCEQKTHADVPHGPWAFVYSLSPKQVLFSGGETFIWKSESLDYWKHFAKERSYDEENFIQKIPSQFNRLLVFDPRHPHGVTRVHGVHRPEQGRLVIHGWFVEPRPYVEGALKTGQVQEPLQEAMFALQKKLGPESRVQGVVSLRFHVGASGSVLKNASLLTNTLVSLNKDDSSTKEITKFLLKTMSALKFPKAKGKSSVTVPVLFKV